MLHISPEEQKARLQERLDRPDKYWKYNPADVTERGFWNEYQEAYQIAITRTSTDAAPWYVVPADRKWYARIAVQRLLDGALEGFDLTWPLPSFDLAAEKKRLKKS
jgi:polyphosphate kinase 2 (PPK2 family)